MSPRQTNPRLSTLGTQAQVDEDLFRTPTSQESAEVIGPRVVKVRPSERRAEISNAPTVLG